MSYLAILATVSVLFWLLLNRCSWLTSLVISVIVFYLTISATNYCFPFWKIYLPQTGVSLAFILLFIGFPIAILNIIVLNKIISSINQNRKQKKEYIFMLILVALGFGFFGFGFIHNAHQSIPINNLNLYLKDREYIVGLIKARTLHGERSCIQNFQLDKKKFELYNCREDIELPEKYKGLSRGGKVYLTKTTEQLFIRFTHSTYNFGDGSIHIVYSSLDNGLSKARWEIE
jgi:hypothetical protein